MISLRLQQISDAKRFYEILNNPNFVYFNACPKSIEDERRWLRKSFEKRKTNLEWNYAILLDGKVVGAIGVTINPHRNHIGEIGYFLEEKHWGKGVMREAVKQAEEICYKVHKLTRIEILMYPENTASENVAKKNGYQKEGLLRKIVKGKDGKLRDCYIYAKV